MKIAVIGGSGFIGSHLCNAFSSFADVVNVDLRKGDSAFEHIPFVERTSLDNLVETLVDVDIAVYAAGGAVPVTSKLNIEFDTRINLMPAVEAFQAIVDAGVRRLIFISSGGALYDDSTIPPFDEKCTVAPRTAYGLSKQMCEDALAFLHRTRGMEVIIVRPSNPYGPGQNPSGKQGVIPIWMKQIFMDEKIILFGSEISKDFIYIEDLVSAIAMLVQAKIDWGIFNIGGGVEYKLAAVLKVIENSLSKRAHIIIREARDFDNVRTALSTELLFKTVGWVPKVSIEEGIEMTKHYVLNLIAS